MAERKAEKGSRLEALKALEKCRKEKDEAVHMESVMRERLRQYESRARSTDALKQKCRTLTQENKELRKQVKSLRQEIGLEASPKFTGKTTKDIINDLQEKERECFSLVEKTGRLGVTVDNLKSELANTVTSKILLEDQVQSLQQNLKDMTNNQRRLLKLWEDKRSQREQLTLPAIGQALKPVQKVLSHKGVQTDMSINSAQKLPANAFETKHSSPQPWQHERRSSIDKRGGLTISGNGHQVGGLTTSGNSHQVGSLTTFGNGHQVGGLTTFGNGHQVGGLTTFGNGHQVGKGLLLGNGNLLTLGNGNHH